MPQMKPIFWFWMYLYMLILLMLFMVFLHYLSIYIGSLKEKYKNNKNKKFMKWLW
uniref:ATP synthase complex subunit 8 n=1 Tax=Wiebesia sp. DWH-2008 TaxID=502689 RepID=D1FKA6_9HYME|nr:ATP synthase subunit 8 [Wiebesia sp. DWH-2008]